MCGVGALIYSAFIWNLTGHPPTSAAGHAAWGRHYQSVAHLLTDRYDAISHAGLYACAVQSPYDLLNALGALFVRAAVVPVWRALGLPFAVLILIICSRRCRLARVVRRASAIECCAPLHLAPAVLNLPG
jgi:hypothetical protein